MIDIEHELFRAIRFAKEAEAKGYDCRLSNRVQWGLSRVQFFGIDWRCYEPSVDAGPMAFIAPVVEGGDLIDLCAIDPLSLHVGTRLDLGHGLGFDTIEKARQRCCTLLVVENALQWLRRPVDSLYLFKLQDIGIVADGVDEFACSSVPLAERVVSLLPPSQARRVKVRLNG